MKKAKAKNHHRPNSLSAVAVTTYNEQTKRLAYKLKYITTNLRNEVIEHQPEQKKLGIFYLLIKFFVLSFQF